MMIGCKWLRSSTIDYLSGTPMECVLARNYSKGLVLVRTAVYGGSSDFLTSVATIQLNGAHSIWP